MNELSLLLQDLRRDAGARQALDRLGEDFNIPPALLAAAAWLGVHGIPPDMSLAGRLDRVASERAGDPPAGGSDGSSAMNPLSAEKVLLDELWRMLGTCSVGPGPETLAGWLLLVVPGSATCLEQSHWLESIRRACLRCR